MLASVSSVIHYPLLNKLIGKLKLYVYPLVNLFADLSSGIILLATKGSGRTRERAVWLRQVEAETNHQATRDSDCERN